MKKIVNSLSAKGKHKKGIKIQFLNMEIGKAHLK
jgi:hypothetical protein